MKVICYFVLAIFFLTFAVTPTGVAVSVDEEGNRDYYSAFEDFFGFFTDIAGFATTGFRFVTTGMMNLVQMLENVYNWIVEVVDPIIRFFNDVADWFVDRYYDFLTLFGMEDNYLPMTPPNPDDFFDSWPDGPPALPPITVY